jgi:hypothetical protein
MNRISRGAVVLSAAAIVLVWFVAQPAWGERPAEVTPVAVKPADIKPAKPKPAEVTDPGPFLGEYTGKFTPASGSPEDAVGKVFGVGDDAYKVVLILTAKETDLKTWVQLQGKADGEKLAISGKAGDADWSGTLQDKQFVAEAKGDKGGKFDLKFGERKSPTEGQKPPKDAIVLLAFEEGKAPSLDAWDNKTWVPAPDGCMHKGKGDIKTNQKFADVQLHLEFMCPYMPAAGGQGRGNSGVYFQDRYEVQVLDSFGLVPQKNECGALYNVAAPKVTASLPPLRWQTYDITFRAPRVTDGKVTKPGTITVLHNGIKIVDTQELPGSPSNPAGARGVVPTGPIKLQDHGNTVKYRNVWLVELKEEEK